MRERGNGMAVVIPQLAGPAPNPLHARCWESALQNVLIILRNCFYFSLVNSKVILLKYKCR